MFEKVVNWFRKLSFHSLGEQTRDSANQPPQRLCERCPRPQVIHFTFMRQRQFAGETHLCQECALNYLPKPRPNHRRQDPVPRVGDVQIEVERLIISEIHDLHTIVFREVEGERRFPLSCGFFEATALDRTLKSLSFPRPLTHEAWQASLTALGAIVEQARIKDLRDGIYFVDLRIRHGNKQVQVDMRPSDAVHIAWKANAPIFINDSLLSEAAGDQSIPA